MLPRLSRSFAIVLLALLWPVAAIGGPAAHVPDELLVRFRAGTAPAHGAALHAAAGAVPLRSFATVRDLHLVKLPRGLSTGQAIARYRRLPEVLYVEPNHVVTLQKTPNDPHFLAGDLWGLDAAILTKDIDIDAPEAWEFATGSPTVVVAVIDSGIDYTHEDLAANMFRNEPDCSANGIDNDGNGFVDDCFGIAPINGNADPIDDNDHGSHVAGIIGAVGNNEIGITGVNWNVRLLPCKMFNADGFGTIAAAIACLDYVALLWTLGQATQPAIGVTPTTRDFGNVSVGGSADASFVVENTGTGTLTGQATTAAPYSIVAGGAYNLTAGQTQTVTVRFSPTATQTFKGTVSFTGGGGASRTVTGVGMATGPSITSFSPAGGAPGISVVIQGGNLLGATAVKLNGTSAAFTVNSGTQVTFTVPANATSGAISVTTPAGTATSTTSLMVTPRITGFTPASGAVGASVVINGANFTKATAVAFNGTAAVFTVNSAIEITATVPAGATTGKMGVTTPAGSATRAANFSVAAAITSFSPTSGAPGTRVTITGSAFTGATAAKFNGFAAAFTVNSSTQITATVPATATTGPISVTSPGGTATSAATFTVAPRITGFTPASGKVGASVVVNGANFTGATAVTFNGTSAVFSVNSAIKITATVPAGATSGKIGVTTPAGSATSAANFAVAPTINSFSPASGAPGTHVTITGATFTGATAVKFNGLAATFMVNSSTQITAAVPATATTGPISVTTPGGTATSATSFTVAPRITSLTPAGGAPGTSVAINGANLTGATAVKFNGTSAVFTVNSPIKITASVPAGAASGPITVTTPAGTTTSASSFSVM